MKSSMFQSSAQLRMIDQLEGVVECKYLYGKVCHTNFDLTYQMISMSVWGLYYALPACQDRFQELQLRVCIYLHL